MSYIGRLSKARSNNDLVLQGSTNIAFGAASNDAAMFISSNDVGIGTSNPVAKFHVVGNANIDDELHVSNHTTTGGLRVSKYTTGAYNSNAPIYFAPSNATNDRLNANSNTAHWASNTSAWSSNNLVSVQQVQALSNYVYESITNIDAFPSQSYLSLSLASNAYVQSNVLSNYVPKLAADATYAPSNVLSNYVLVSNMAADFAPSNTLSNYVRSNVAYSTFALSNALQAYLLTSTAQSTYVRSSILSNYSTTAVADTRYGPSNAVSFAYFKSQWASNTASFTSNALSNYITSIQAESSNANVYASNTAANTSNAFAAYQVNASNVFNALSQSNAWTSNALSNYAPSNLQGNWNVAYTLSIWTSNALPSYARSNAQSNWNFASNVSVFASNSLSNYLTSVAATSQYATSNAQSNWVYSSNTASFTSNALSNYATASAAASGFASSNAQSNWNYGSNTATFASNNFSLYTTTVISQSAYAVSNAQSNWNYASNTSAWSSNAVVWTSNAQSNFINITSMSNWVFASNTSVAASNTSYWLSNASSNLLSLSLASNAYAPSNTLSNWVFSSNTATFLSNNTLRLSGGQMTGAIDMNNNALTFASNAYISQPAGSSNLTVKAQHTGQLTDSNNAPLLSWFTNPSNRKCVAIHGSGGSNIAQTQNFVVYGSAWFSNDASFMTRVGVGTESPAYALDVTGTVNATTNFLKNGIAIESIFAASNGQSNWNSASNVAYWGSNNTSNLLPLSAASNAYAASNAQSNWVFASNTAAASSNVAYWGSNNTSNLLSLATASNAYAVSNAQSNWVFSSNTAAATSNVAYWGSNNTSNLLPLALASNAYAASNAQSNWVFASNTSQWTSNALSNYALSNMQSNWNYASNTAFFASNTTTWGSNYTSNVLLLSVASNAYAFSNAQSNWVFASNTASWSSNVLPMYALSNSQSNWVYASNVGTWTSNQLPQYAASNAQSNWVYASNTAMQASNVGAFASNAAAFASNTAVWTSNMFPSYAESNAQSNWVYASNTAFVASNTASWGSNALSNHVNLAVASNAYATSNAQSNWVYASNLAFNTQISLSNYALSNAQSNWNYGSNLSAITNPIAVYASNTVVWTSNTFSNYKTATENQALFSSAVNQSNWNYASNAAFYAQQTSTWSSNSLSNYLSSTTASNAYTQQANASNWNYASNTAAFASSSLSNYLPTTTASNAYAPSNAQSNWNYGSNFHSNNPLRLAGTLYSTACNLYASGMFTLCNQSPIIVVDTGTVTSGVTVTNVANTSQTFTTTSNEGLIKVVASNANWNALSILSNTTLNAFLRTDGTAFFASNVGIGTNNPTNLLHLSGGNFFVCNGGITTDSGGSLNIGIAAQPTFSPMCSIQGRLNNASTQYTSLSGGMGFLTRPLNTGSNTSLVEVMRLTNAGSLGIGTTSPAYTLDVNGSMGVASNIFFGTALRQMLNLWSTSYAIGIQSSTLYIRTGNDVQVYKGGSHSDVAGDAGSGGTAMVTIKTSGNVGIGTQSPSFKLDVAGTGRINGILTTSNIHITQATAGGYISLNQGANLNTAANANFPYYGIGCSTGGVVGIGGFYGVNFYTNSSAPGMSLTSTGLGIGTSSPAYALDAVGAGRIQGTGASLYLTGTAGVGATVGIELQTYDPIGDASPGRILATDDGNYSASIDLQTKVPGNSINALTSRIYVASAGNIGIGTTDPRYKLHVNAGDVVISNGGNAVDQGGAINYGVSAFPTYGPMAAIQGRLSSVSTTYGLLSGGMSFLVRPSIASANTALTEAMRITRDGNVGIGTTSPATKFVVAGEIASTTSSGLRIVSGSYGVFLRNDGSNFYVLSTASNDQYGTNSTNRPFAYAIASGLVTIASALYVEQGGYVGIGTNNPAYPLHITSTQSATFTYGYLNSSGLTGTTTNGTGTYSIYVTGRVAASEFNAVSDARIKTSVTAVDPEHALTCIHNLKPVSYRMIDTVMNGDKTTYGFVAQQVESVIENAVREANEFIPNIYDLATVVDGNIITLSKNSFDVLESLSPTSAAVRLKLIVEDANEREIIVTITKFLDDKTVIIDRELSQNKVFVYGQEVDNFKTINTNAILSITVSALQRTNAKCEALLKENALLREQLDILTSKVSAIEEKIRM